MVRQQPALAIVEPYRPNPGQRRFQGTKRLLLETTSPTMNRQLPASGRLFDFPLTLLNGNGRMRLNRARSSMVEQWPFKPLVAGSSPAALIIADVAYEPHLTPHMVVFGGLSWRHFWIVHWLL